MMTITRYRYITKHLCLLLLLLMAVGVQRTWAVDDKFTVTDETSTTLGATIYSGTYTTLTLGVSTDASGNMFAVHTDSGEKCIYGTVNPQINGSSVGADNIPNQGTFYKIVVYKPGELVFKIKLNKDKRVYFRNSDGNNINTRENNQDNLIYDWAVSIDNPGTYYLFASGSNLPLFSYTFTRKVPKGITSTPYQTDFSSDVEPFDDGNIVSVASTNNVLTLNSVAPNSGVAVAGFKKPYTLKSTEQVTLSFTAYHGYLNKDRFSRVTLYNSDDCPLISYTYSKSSKEITDISFNEVVADGFLAFNAQSHWSGENGANGFAGNGRPFTNTAGDNPVITMTVSGNGTVSFNLTRGWGSVNKTFSDQLAGVKMDLAYIKVEDTSDNADRGIGIDNLKITSQLASLDYETGVVDWTTSVNGRYTPVIATDGSNHYLSVNQTQRADGSGGATLTSTTLNGRVDAGQDFTLSFDMKIGNNNRSGSSGPPTLTIFAANNSDYIFKMYSTAKDNTEWKLNDLDNVNLSGTGTFSGENGLVSLEWYHYIISKTGDKVYVTIDSDNGTKHYYRKGIANSSVGGLGNFQFVTGKDHANFAIDNIKVVPYASTAFSQDGKVETYTIMGAGDLPQKDEGNTITIEYGTTNEVQMTEQLAGTEYFGSYAVDTNIGTDNTGRYLQAYGTTGATMVGTFYKLTPKYDGKLTITGWMSDVNNITIINASGGVVEDWKSANITANTLFTHSFTTTLTAGTDYYLYGCAPNTVNTGSTNEGTDNYAILHLIGFTFTQDAMNRQVNVNDLLYEAGKSGTALKRIIPGFELEYSAGVTSSADHQSLAFTNGSTLTVTLRQNGYSATVSSVTLVGSDGANIATGYTVDTSVAGKATVTATTNLENVAAFIIGYTADDAQSYKLWLNEDKENIDDFSFENGHVMRVPGDNRTFSQAPTFDAVSSYYVPNFAYKSSNTSVATINTDGSNGQLRKAGSVTIMATFAETDYFLSKSATYTVDNVLRANETYDVDVANDKILRIGAYADVASTALSLLGGRTSASSFTYGTTLEKLYTRTTSEGTVTVKNETDNNITINTLQVLTPTPVAWLYYEGQEENYAQQLVFKDFSSGPVKGFRVLDIGDPTDPIDLTSAYSLKSGVGYVWTNGTLVTSHGNTFNTGNGEFKISSKASGGETTLPKVSHVLTKTGTAEGYADDLTADANIYVATPTIDGDDTYYYTWDMTASVSSSGQLDSRWTWNGHGYYQAWMPEYLPILNISGKTLAGNEGLLVKGDLRYHTGSTGLRMNLTRVNAHLKFPVKAGMEVKIVMASAAADIEHIISNVTTVRGDATNSLYIEQAGVNTPITAYYLAKADGAIEIHSMDKMGGYIKSITLQVPRIHFNEEIITVKNQVASLSNPTINTGDATITYSILGSYNLDGTTAGSTLAEITDPNKNNVDITTTNEGYVIVKAVNSSATGVQPKQGTYRIYMIDFGYKTPYYDKTTDEDANGVVDFPSLDLASEVAKNNGGEAWFDKRPDGYDKVVQPVTYTMSVVDGSPRGRLIQTTDSDPTKTTYKLSAYSAGTIRVTATTGRITTYCDVTISGGDNLYAEMAPVRLLEDLPTEAATHYFTMALPTGLNQSYTSYTVDVSGDVTCDGATTTSEVIDEVTYYYTKISNIAGNGGAIRVTATDNNNTPGDNTDDKVVQFVLTIPYSASTGHKWNFYQMKNYDHDSNSETYNQFGLKIGHLADYDSNASQTLSDVDISGSGWTTADTKWEKVYRKGNEQPRWAYAYSVHGDNAFIVEETAGLQIETGPQGFYIDNPHQPTEFGYNHIGLHNNATVTIPRLKAGDYIALNLSRVLPNNGAILSATNVTDLAGTAVNHTFTITRSQIDYQDAGVPVTEISGDNVGARVIPGYYTFRAAADGDVSFTLSDEGYLDILSIEIYDGSYKPTMTDIVTDGTNVAPPATFLMDDGETEEVNLAICHLMKSTSVGPAEYVVVDKVGGLDATLENVEWVSDGGALYNKGKITVNDSYGKLLVRMNNYTADGRYLTGYTPTYSLTVGHKPHQDYPFTWNFENISGGAVKGHNNNAYNSISTDYYTWQNLGYETFMLNTTTATGSLYVPGATLVASSHDLGQKGEISYLNANNYGCDEFNGLGFTGQIAFKLAQQGETANDVPTGVWAQGKANSLLEYTVDGDEAYMAQKTVTGTSPNEVITWTSARLDAGDGYVTFGSPGKLESTKKGDDTYITTSHYAYRMDGGNTKNVLLEPQRPFQNGDIIHLKGYAPNTVNPQKSGFSFYVGANDAGSAALATVYFAADAVVDREYSIDYTIKYGDGICGRSQVYLCRADKTTTVLLSEVSITGDDSSAPTAYERALTCNGDVTVTIPDLKQDYYVYIKSSATPKTIPSNLTAAVAEDGLDAIEEEAVGDIHKHVYKYKVLTAGNADVTFANGTKIYRIGVTNIMKEMKRVGTGDAWATESRNHAIDYTQTGQFTINDIKANTVTAKSYTGNKVTVKMNEKTDAMPAETGMVLKLKLAYTTDDEKSAGVKMTTEEASAATTAAVADFAKAKGGNQVPLFYPPYSSTILNSSAVAFGGTEGNLMKANTTSKTFTSEIETIDAVDYVPFIFADRYMKWTKIDNSVEHTDFINSGNVPVFYRMHLYTSAEAAAMTPATTAETLNTLGANKAYMLIRSGNVPDALWKSSGGGGGAKPFIPIEGVSDMEEIIDGNNGNNGTHVNNGTYTLSGQRVNDNGNLPPGIYIRNGKKVVVK